jgi:hypothetical protein
VSRALIVLFGALAFFAVTAESSCGGSAAPAQSSAAAGDKTPAAAATPKVLLNIAGTGTKTTQTFAAHSNWDMAWSYDCSSFGAQGNFIVSVYNSSDNTPNFDNQGVNQLGKKGADVDHYHSGGSFYLKVISECKWTINVTG